MSRFFSNKYEALYNTINRKVIIDSTWGIKTYGESIKIEEYVARFKRFAGTYGITFSENAKKYIELEKRIKELESKSSETAYKKLNFEYVNQAGEDTANKEFLLDVFKEDKYTLDLLVYVRGNDPETTYSEVYINGIKASKSDIKRLCEDLKNGKQRATAHTTKGGALAIITEF